MTQLSRGITVTALALSVLGCGETERERPRARRDVGTPAGDTAVAAGKTDGAAETKPAAAASVSGWGTIKGRVVWAGADVPAMPTLDVQKDTEWCLKEGPLKAQTIVVDPQTKGVANIFLYLKSAPAIHPDFPQSAQDVRKAYEESFKEANGVEFANLQSAHGEGKLKLRDIKAPVLIDQVHCRYVPHALAAREGQPTIVLNPEPIPHNVNVQSFKPQNQQNPNMPPDTFATFEWVSDTQPIAIACNIHGWMNMRAMCFDHPYYAVTGNDGSFEIAKVPAGELVLIARGDRFIDVETGGKGSAKGNAVTVKPDETLELVINMQPE